MYYLKSLPEYELKILQELAEKLNLGMIPERAEIALFQGLLDSADDMSGIKEALSDEIGLPRFKKYLDILPDVEDTLGCWVWTGASQSGIRPVFREGNQTLSVRARVLEEIVGVIAPPRARIASTCGTPNCVRPEHIKVSLSGVTLYPATPDPLVEKLLEPEKSALQVRIDATAKRQEMARMRRADPTVPVEVSLKPSKRLTAIDRLLAEEKKKFRIPGLSPVPGLPSTIHVNGEETSLERIAEHLLRLRIGLATFRAIALADAHP